MTESSRYLTNKLHARAYEEKGEKIPKKYDNDQNGMTDWILQRLQEMLRTDFYEYNARGYMFESRLAIQNLFEFAADGQDCWRSVNPLIPSQPPRPRSCDVRRAARNVLDYLAGRFAISSNGLRRAAPFRRHIRNRDYPRLFGRASDYMTWRYLAYLHGAAMFWTNRYGRVDPATAPNLQHAYFGEYRVPSLITDFTGDEPLQYYQRSYNGREDFPAVEVYFRERDYLITAGGLHDDGRMGWLSDEEDAWAQPTTLMPARAGLDRREFVTIDGDRDEEDRVNTCVGPHFACGVNPSIPPGLPERCVLTRGDWIFLDFDGKSQGCDLNYGYGVVMLRKPCFDDCDGAFGFFEVVPIRTNLEDLAEQVISDNKGWNFEAKKINLYKGPTGRFYSFVPVPGEELKSGFVSLAEGAVKTTYEQDMRKWPLIDGEIMKSEDHKGCVIIDNPRMKQRLILDLLDWNAPKRTRVWLNSDCGCPVLPYCLPPRQE